MSKLSLSISRKLGTKLNKTEEEIAVLNYGLFAVLQTSFSFLLTLLIGVLCGFALEIMTVCLTITLLKRYTGGVHSSTPKRCLFMGLFFVTGATILNKQILSNLDDIYVIWATLIILALNYTLLYKLCPVPCKNKPLKKESTRKRLRKYCFKTVLIYTILLISMFIGYILTDAYIFKTIAISIVLGISIQIFALTKTGHSFFDLTEKLFDLFKSKKK